MRSAWILIAIGLAAIALPLNAFFAARESHERDRQTVERLQADLDSTRGALDAATTAVDSVRLVADIESREYFLGRRAYHVVPGEDPMAGWWGVTRAPTISVTLGVVLVIAGSGLLVRARRGASPNG